MKRFFILLALAALLPLRGMMAEDRVAAKIVHQYEAYVIEDTILRKEITDRVRSGTLKNNTKVLVNEVGETWSQISYRGQVGYVKTEKLARFRSLDPEKYPVPGRIQTIGVVTLTGPARVSGGRFEGVTLKEGAILCVSQAVDRQYTLPVWRHSGVVAAAVGAFQPFTPWREAQAGDLIGGFTTYYNKTTGAPLAKERIYNIDVGCQRIQGRVLKPGQQFSFNRACAPYSQGNGYRLGPAINASGVGYGGGVCQVSTTLYNAILGLPLQVDAWAIHRRNGVKYIPQWFDACVGAYSDLRFTNTMPYPIRIWADAQGGAVSVLIYRAE